jgi:hypothetical protein
LLARSLLTTDFARRKLDCSIQTRLIQGRSVKGFPCQA